MIRKVNKPSIILQIKPGTILISGSTLDDPNFEQVVIFITEYNQNGAMGFVINKLHPRKFNELVEFKNSKSFSLYEGGPVEYESLFFLHNRPDLIEGGIHVVDSVFLGGDFKKAVSGINSGILNENNLKLFIGYCGWDFGQLEEEIEEGGWIVHDTTTQTVFNDSSIDLWDQLFPSL